MNNERREKLEEYLKKEPRDPFLLYALALEWEKSDEKKALEYYNTLLTEHPEYSGTYYHAARLYGSMGEMSRAREIFEKGIDTLQKKKDAKSLRELQSAYNEFLMDLEDDE